MATTLFEHQPYDPVRERRKRIRIIVAVVVILTLAALLWLFAALQVKNYEQAYSVWMNDPGWKQHPQQYARYPFGAFYLDWGPGGEYGIIQNYHVDGAAKPPGREASGVVVVVTVNQRAEKAHIWVEKATKTLSFSPY